MDTSTPDVAMVVATVEGYDGLKMTLPNGRVVVGKTLPLARAAYYLRLQEQMKVAAPAEVLELREQIITTFPAEAGLETELNQLTLGEFWMVFWCFFGLRVRSPSNGTTPALTGASS